MNLTSSRTASRRCAWPTAKEKPGGNERGPPGNDPGKREAAKARREQESRRREEARRLDSRETIFRLLFGSCARDAQRARRSLPRRDPRAPRSGPPTFPRSVRLPPPPGHGAHGVRRVLAQFSPRVAPRRVNPRPPRERRRAHLRAHPREARARAVRVGRSAARRAEGVPERRPAGALVVLVDERTGSDAELAAETIKSRNLGRVVGRRTWGGLLTVGSGRRLVDGGSVSAPTQKVVTTSGDEDLLKSFQPAGGNGVENRGWFRTWRWTSGPRTTRSGGTRSSTPRWTRRRRWSRNAAAYGARRVGAAPRTDSPKVPRGRTGTSGGGGGRARATPRGQAGEDAVAVRGVRAVPRGRRRRKKRRRATRIRRTRRTRGGKTRGGRKARGREGE